MPMSNIKDWDSADTFEHMDDVMVKDFSHLRELIWKTIENNDKPDHKTITEAIALDLFGFTPEDIIKSK